LGREEPPRTLPEKRVKRSSKGVGAKMRSSRAKSLEILKGKARQLEDLTSLHGQYSVTDLTCKKHRKKRIGEGGLEGSHH